ncbi:MAG: hypothetical protein DRJ31_09310 [Candidatus Methanomethylicota archaeon]|uniref:Uncharacterized protein n=1 Tax=Thermoproteota archaeon TaxID=2056631 RepID=A0A497EL30_9CREN|nr:MAG: hypothetical protein DRJ31_09310 [Candidatus Verstraetearchaeota archaeon]
MFKTHLSNKLFVDINSVRREKFFFEGDDIKLRYKSDIIFLSDYTKVASWKSFETIIDIIISFNSLSTDIYTK